MAENFDPRALAQAYVDNGAAAVSVLTDPRFQGTLDDLEAVVQVAAQRRTPVIRKDFIFDPYQVYEARSRGADGLLLIAAILSPSHLAEMLAVCQELWLQALVEVHNEKLNWMLRWTRARRLSVSTTETCTPSRRTFR